MLRILAGIGAAMGIVCAAGAQPSEPEHARARLISEFDAITPGRTSWLGVLFDIDPEWHLYWDGQNASGLPVQLEIKAPEGYKVGEPLWPAPMRHVSEGDLLDHIYEKQLLLMFPVEAPAAAAPGSKAKFDVDGKWLVCRQVCVMGTTSQSLTLPVASKDSEPKSTPRAGQFKSTRERIPKPLRPGDDAVALKWTDAGLEIKSKGAQSLEFYPGNDSTKFADLIHDDHAKGDTLLLHTEGPVSKARIAGVVAVTRQSAKDPAVYWIDSRPAGANPGPARPSNPASPSGG